MGKSHLFFYHNDESLITEELDVENALPKNQIIFDRFFNYFVKLSIMALNY